MVVSLKDRVSGLDGGDMAVDDEARPTLLQVFHPFLDQGFGAGSEATTRSDTHAI